MTFHVSSIPPPLALPPPGPHRMAGLVCLAAGKGCCHHFTPTECIDALRQGEFSMQAKLASSRRAKWGIRREQHLNRPNPYR